MGDHYYSETPLSAHEMRTFSFVFQGRELCFETDAGVFSKAHMDKGTALLGKSLPDAFTGRALDLGCGWGALGAMMGVKWPQASIDMVDINARAVALAQKNMQRNQLLAHVYQSDGLLQTEGLFDIIVSNPPIRAGKAVLHALYAQSIQRLSPGGKLFLVVRKQQGAESTLSLIKERMYRAEVINRSGGFWVIQGEKGAEEEH